MIGNGQKTGRNMPLNTLLRSLDVKMDFKNQTIDHLNQT